MRCKHKLAWPAGLAILAAGATSLAATAANPAKEGVATIAGPVTGGRGQIFSASPVDLAPYGYTEQEYFISGEAHAFEPAPGTELAKDGRWTLVPVGADRPYRTRMIVRKPAAAKFNGTVVIEFMQEYFSREADSNFRWNAETLLRNGFGWVGVSLHREGVDGPPAGKEFMQYTGSNQNLKIPLGPALTKWDPARYGSLTIPSSEMSYDMLTQVARAVGPRRQLSGIDPFKGLKVRKVMAVGDTVAAQRLIAYINGVEPMTRAIDGFVLKDALAPYSAKGEEAAAGMTIRTDVAVPVIVFNAAGLPMADKRDSPMLRYWSAAGSSHTTGPYMQRVQETNRRDLPGLMSAVSACPARVANTFPVQYISGNAIMSVQRWMVTKKPAPSFPFVQLGKTDANGNDLGGIRTPWTDVPIATYDRGGTCLGGAGRTTWFDEAKLKSLYGTPAGYLARFTASARKAEQAGVLQRDDVESGIREAAAIKF